MAKRQDPTVTEQTGKKWKTLQLAGFFACVASVLMFFAGWGVAGFLLFLLGLLTFCLGRIFAWWFHG